MNYGDPYSIDVDYLLGQQAQITQEIVDAQAAALSVAGGSSTQIVGLDSGGNPIPINVTGDSNGLGLSVSGGALTGTLPQNLQSTANVTFASLALAASGTAVTNWIGASATLDFPNTAAQTSSDLTITVTGAALNDVVILGVPNGSVNASSCYTAWVSAADQVTVRHNNYSAGAIDPASGTFKVLVIQW